MVSYQCHLTNCILSMASYQMLSNDETLWLQCNGKNKNQKVQIQRLWNWLQDQNIYWPKAKLHDFHNSSKNLLAVWTNFWSDSMTALIVWSNRWLELKLEGRWNDFAPIESSFVPPSLIRHIWSSSTSCTLYPVWYLWYSLLLYWFSTAVQLHWNVAVKSSI